MVVYRTNNIASNFTNGQCTATVTKVNGVSVVNGGSVSIGYNCSDTGYYDYLISAIGYDLCGSACDSTVVAGTTVYATVSSGGLLSGQYLFTNQTGSALWEGGNSKYYRINRVGGAGNGYSVFVLPTGRIVSVSACTSVSPGTCGPNL
jgi:hypothetical protein